MLLIRDWMLAAGLVLAAPASLALAQSEASRSPLPDDGFGLKQTMSGIICDSEAALESAFEILGGLTAEAYRHFNTFEMDPETLSLMRPGGCDTATIRGVARVKSTRSLHGETVLVFEIKGRAEYWERSGEADGVFYSWLGSGR